METKNWTLLSPISGAHNAYYRFCIFRAPPSVDFMTSCCCPNIMHKKMSSPNNNDNNNNNSAHFVIVVYWLDGPNKEALFLLFQPRSRIQRFKAPGHSNIGIVFLPIGSSMGEETFPMLLWQRG